MERKSFLDLLLINWPLITLVNYNRITNSLKSSLFVIPLLQYKILRDSQKSVSVSKTKVVSCYELGHGMTSMCNFQAGEKVEKLSNILAAHMHEAYVDVNCGRPLHERSKV